jgi:hypothetical protein
VKVFLQNAGGDHAKPTAGRIVATVNEALTNTDHNGDADALDFVFRAFDLTGAPVMSGLVCPQNSVPVTDTGALWAYLRSEVLEVRDLDGDGDQFDFVLGLWKP